MPSTEELLAQAASTANPGAVRAAEGLPEPDGGVSASPEPPADAGGSRDAVAPEPATPVSSIAASGNGVVVTLKDPELQERMKRALAEAALLPAEIERQFNAEDERLDKEAKEREATAKKEKEEHLQRVASDMVGRFLADEDAGEITVITTRSSTPSAPEGPDTKVERRKARGAEEPQKLSRRKRVAVYFGLTDDPREEDEDEDDDDVIEAGETGDREAG